ncbi:hypothetical protein JG688_00015037 [Phytophthora aleatoria]|uniref:Uncharacterized protein n=1 Tax=Phytophthora aleatoria TaxID=2496075 RepID=A0A8J5IWB0_9STRA|nr:hypothetical protein JG688_00015037 [Phytophthora aleatoria]
MSRLRSGRVRPHPLVIEDAAIQIAVLAELEPAKPATSNDPNRLSPSGDTTVTDVSSHGSPSSAIDVTNRVQLSGDDRSLQRTSVALSPGSELIDDIPDWFAEPYESDGYDTEGLMLITRPISPSWRQT